jgi:predicted metalloprotease with PDZ domain
MARSLLLAFGLLWAQPASAAEPVRYTLRFPAPHTHYVEVEARFPSRGRSLELWMPVWTPGSYLVREYSRHLEGLRVTDAAGEALEVEQVAKNRWAVRTVGTRSVVARYRLYAHELSVRTNWVEADFAFLVGAATFLSGRGLEGRAHEVAVERPAAWPGTWMPLPAVEGAADTFRAADYDALVDAPLAVGAAHVQGFEVSGTPHQIVSLGDTASWDHERTARDLRALVNAQQAFWGGPLPYPRYQFLNLLVGHKGGLEHRDSATVMSSGRAQRPRASYLRWLSVFSHELFHAWNVKRLRPAELGPFDYENEVPTRALWVAEGITSYYDDLLLARAGLITRAEYLERLSGMLESVHTRAGRHVRSLEQASFDAWIKQYRPDENSANVTISYYSGGAVVAWLLDAELRRVSGGARGLDDVMRAALARFPATKGYTLPALYALMGEVAGADLGPWLQRHAQQPLGDPDLSGALGWWGLRFEAAKPAGEEPAGWLGAELRHEDGLHRVHAVPRGTPAFTAGLNAGDELVAIAGRRLDAKGAAPLLAWKGPGPTQLLVARRGLLKSLSVVLGSPPNRTWTLEIDPQAPPEAVARRDVWLGTANKAPRKD